MKKVSAEHKRQVRANQTARTRAKHNDAAKALGFNSYGALLTALYEMNARQRRAIRNLIESVSMPEYSGRKKGTGGTK